MSGDGFVVYNDEALTASGLHLVNVHSETACRGRECVVHRPSDHSMRTFPLHWRGDRGIFERICSHGTGHPDPDQFGYWVERYGEYEADAIMAHGCCGCCAP